MKRTIVQSLLFALAVVISYYIIQIGVGMYQTLTYVPDVVHRYESVEYLQTKVLFGRALRPGGMWELASVTFGSMILFIVCKGLYNKRKKAS